MNTTLVNQIKQEFLDKFNEEPLMVFSPGRINIIGEHTDYNDGFVFPAAVNKGIIAAINKTQNQHIVCLLHSDFNDTISFSIDSISSYGKRKLGELCFRCYCRNSEIGKALKVILIWFLEAIFRRERACHLLPL